MNNQNKDVRLMGAKEVLARLQEDESRKDDPALTALVNKMLQDPYQPIKNLLQWRRLRQERSRVMKNCCIVADRTKNNKNYGEDALKASNRHY